MRIAIMKKENEQEKLPPLINKEILIEIEKVFRRIWEKEKKMEELFKKSASLHETTQTLLARELCKPENEQNPQIISSLYGHIRETEEAIDMLASLTRELRTIREGFYESLSAPREIAGNVSAQA